MKKEVTSNVTYVDAPDVPWKHWAVQIDVTEHDQSKEGAKTWMYYDSHLTIVRRFNSQDAARTWEQRKLKEYRS